MYPEETRDKILGRIANGESLRGICRTEGMPPAPTVCRWLAEDESFRERYARAREAQADALFDDILDIADNSKDCFCDTLGHAPRVHEVRGHKPAPGLAVAPPRKGAACK